jgi:hypothetical protein
MMAKHRFVVLIDQETGVHIAHFSGREMLALRACDLADEGNRLALLRWCQQFLQARIIFLSNLADEHYHVETLPHVRGAAGRQFLLRKLAAWPFAQGLHTVFRLNSVKTLRKEDRFLFAAIFYPPLSAWLPELQRQSLRIEGMYTQALTLACWLPALPKGVVHRLCIQCRQQQVRISYLQQVGLFFSRLISLPREGFSDLDVRFERIAQEANQTRMTLTQQRWIQEADVLQIVWLGEVPDDVGEVKKYLPSHYLWVCIPALELSRQFAGNPAPEGLDVMDWAAMHSVLERDALPNLAPAEALRPRSIARLKRQLHWAGVAMTSLMLLAGWMGIQATKHDLLQAEQLNHRLQGFKSAQPVSEMSLSQLPRLRALTQTVQTLEASARLPDDALLLLHSAVEDISHWQLTTLEWEANWSTDSPDDGKDDQQALLTTWITTEFNHQAQAEWQQLYKSLQSLPGIEKVEVVRPSDAYASPRQGDTRQMPSADKVILKLYLKRTQEMAQS